MSKTDKTKPFWVKLAHGDLAWEESHDHADGPCDLTGPEDLDSYGLVAALGRRCHRRFVYTGIHVCCCAMCHGDFSWDVRPGKRQRLDGKKACRDWVREY